MDNLDKLKIAPVGSRIWFGENWEKRPYKVRARSERFLVCTKPFNLKKTVFYTIIDLEEKIRGTENLVFSMGAESDQDCADMIERLEGREPKSSKEELDLIKSEIPDFKDVPFFQTEVSHRNRRCLNVNRVEYPKTKK